MINANSNKNNNLSKNLKKIIFFISSCVFVVSASLLVKQLVIDPFVFEKNMDKIKKVKKESQMCDFKSLLEINPDIRGWIKIDGTPIDYPVLQSGNDEPIYYLDRDYQKQKDKNGSIFINSYSELLDKDTKNIVMHGHNMGSGKMFASILKYADVNFFREHSIINFDTIYEPAKWKVFAIIKTNSKEEHGPIFDYYSPNFNSSSEFFNLIYDIKLRSLINVSIDFSKDDKILSMSTCSPRSELDGFRTAVFARKIRDGEDEYMDPSKISVNNNPLMPEGWYRSKNKKMPTFPSFSESLNNGSIDWISECVW